MKAYVITAGEYSDYGILHVTLDKEKAEKFCAYYNSHTEDSYEYACVETYDLDDFEVDEKIEPIYHYDIKFNFYNGGIWSIAGVLEAKKEDQINEITYKRGKIIAHANVYLDKQDELNAKKIAQDMLAKYKAEMLEL